MVIINNTLTKLWQAEINGFLGLFQLLIHIVIDNIYNIIFIKDSCFTPGKHTTNIASSLVFE